jgi:hypothetical protein
MESTGANRKTVIAIVVVILVIVLIVIGFIAMGSNNNTANNNGAQQVADQGQQNQTGGSGGTATGQSANQKGGTAPVGQLPPQNAVQPTGNQLTSIDAPVPTLPYVSAKDSFSINFTGAPIVTATTFNSPTAGPIPMTTYKETFSKSNGTGYYAVYVYHYPASYQFVNDYLNGALNTFTSAVKINYPGAQITNQNTIQFQGQSALSALINIPITRSGKTTNTGDYLIVTTKGQDAYIISTYDMVQSNFTAFSNSFAFTK